MKVVIRPLPIKRWHGKEGVDSFTQPITLEVLYDHNTGGYATGLTPEEAQEYGKRLGVDLSSDFNPEKPHPFWASTAAQIKLPNHAIMLDPEKPMEFVKIKNLKASSRVANTLKEWEEGKYPNATHYIYDEDEETEAQATKVEKEMKCVMIGAKMSADEKINVIQILGDKSVRGRSQNFINVELKKIMDDKPDEFIRISKLDKNEVYVRAAVLEAIHRHILTKEGTSVFYMGDQIGIDLDSAVGWFLDPINQKQKAAILGKLTV